MLGKEKHNDADKEIIRRLRIQNKKLIEQVIRLKGQIKEIRINKNQVLGHITELVELINANE